VRWWCDARVYACGLLVVATFPCLAGARHSTLFNLMGTALASLGHPPLPRPVACGLQWLQTKYEMLGRFPDAWFGDTLPIAPCFHRDARDALWSAHGPARVAQLYHAQVWVFGACGPLQLVVVVSCPPPPPYTRPGPPSSPRLRSASRAWGVAALVVLALVWQVLLTEAGHPGELQRQLAAGVCVRVLDHHAAIAAGARALGMPPPCEAAPGSLVFVDTAGVDASSLPCPGVSARMEASGEGGASGGAFGGPGGEAGGACGASARGSGGAGGVEPPSAPPAPPVARSTVSAHDKAWLIANITKQYL
jgi:hypothetical protein